METTTTKARKQGKEAALAGKDRNTCPYYSGQPERKAWLDGFRKAEKKAETVAQDNAAIEALVEAAEKAPVAPEATPEPEVEAEVPAESVDEALESQEVAEAVGNVVEVAPVAPQVEQEEPGQRVDLTGPSSLPLVAGTTARTPRAQRKATAKAKRKQDRDARVVARAAKKAKAKPVFTGEVNPAIPFKAGTVAYTVAERLMSGFSGDLVALFAGVQSTCPSGILGDLRRKGIRVTNEAGVLSLAKEVK